MNDFTLDDLAAFSRNEKDDLNEIFKKHIMVEMPKVELEPRDESVNRVLNYNRALSVRDSKKMEKVTVVLN